MADLRDNALTLDTYLGRTAEGGRSRWRWDVTALRHGVHIITEVGYSRFRIVALLRVGAAIRALHRQFAQPGADRVL